MEVIPMAVNNHELSNTFRIASPLVVDEAMLEKVLGVMIFLFIVFLLGTFLYYQDTSFFEYFRFL